MRSLVIALMLAAFPAPALAQVQPGNPNAANQSLSTMSRSRADQQGRAAQGNAAAMGVQRGQAAAPPPPASLPPVGAPRGGR